MTWLLDTQVAIYAIAAPDKLLAHEKDILSQPATRLFISLVTIWEVAIKNGLPGRGRRDPFPMNAFDTLNAFRSARFQILAIEATHICAVENLASIHRDPFDRLLVAQAKTEKMNLVTRDKALHLYFAP